MLPARDAPACSHPTSRFAGADATGGASGAPGRPAGPAAPGRPAQAHRHPVRAAWAPHPGSPPSGGPGRTWRDRPAPNPPGAGRALGRAEPAPRPAQPSSLTAPPRPVARRRAALAPGRLGLRRPAPPGPPACQNGRHPNAGARAPTGRAGRHACQTPARIHPRRQPCQVLCGPKLVLPDAPEEVPCRAPAAGRRARTEGERGRPRRGGPPVRGGGRRAAVLRGGLPRAAAWG